MMRSDETRRRMSEAQIVRRQRELQTHRSPAPEPLHPLIVGLFDVLPEPHQWWPRDARRKWLEAAEASLHLLYDDERPPLWPLARCEFAVLRDGRLQITVTDPPRFDCLPSSRPSVHRDARRLL